MPEIWKPILLPIVIPNAFISSFGKVKYLNKFGKFKNTFGSAQSGRYLQVKLCTNTTKKKYCVHILVALNFLERKCKKFTVVHHKNGVRSCNHVTNLEFTSQQLNCSLRMNSSLCIKKKNLYYAKFIFDGVIIKSHEAFETAEQARAKAIIMRRNMYDLAYNALIEEEKINENENRNSTEQNSNSRINENCITICNKSKN